MSLVLPKVIAHRGAPQVTPENTLASMRMAHELGATWIEFDVQLTKDNVPVIMHDFRLQRTTNGRGLVSEKTYAQLAELDTGGWFADQYSGEKIPTLEQYLQLAAELGLGINIELKSQGKSAEILVQAVDHAIKQCWHDDLPKPLISSFDKRCLRAMRRQCPDAQLAFLSPRWFWGWKRVWRELGCVSFNYAMGFLTAKRVQKLKSAGLLVVVYTVDDPRVAHGLFAMGVDAVFSNDPCLLMDN